MASTTCGHCERFANFTYRWGEVTDTQVRVAATCDFCGKLSVAIGTKTTGQGPVQASAGANYSTPIGLAWGKSPDLQWWPRVGVAPQVEDVPPHIARAAREAYSSASIGNHMSAVLMARTVVEATAKAKGIDVRGLDKKINAMKDAGLIRPGIAEQAHEVRFAGNDMAHGDIDIDLDANDSEEILALMAEVLSEVFQGPARLERIRAKRTGAPAAEASEAAPA